MRLFCALLIPVFVWFSSPVSARIYQYRDKDGVAHFTDRLSDIPEDQLPEARPLGEREKRPIPEGPRKIPGKKDEAPGKDQEAAKEKGDGSGQRKEIPIIKNLNREKTALDSEHAKLVEKKKALKNERSTLKTPEEVRAYQEKVRGLNKRIGAYEKRNRSFKKRPADRIKR